MTLKQQKIICASLIAIVVVGGLEILALIINLDQPAIFLKTAFVIYLYLLAKMAFLYDLHFKNPGALSRAKTRHESVSHWLHRLIRILASAFWDRIQHMRRWTYFRHFQNYLLLPALIFWSTVCLLYLNLGRIMLQQTFIIISSIGLVLTYWHLKEIFHRKKEIVDHGIFVALSAVKLYTAFITFSAVLGIVKFFCLSQNLFVLAVFSLSALLIYQALFQHNLIKLKTLLLGLAAALIMGFAAWQVYGVWGQNYFTAGGFLMVVYNFLWSLYHHYLDKTLTKKSFFELLVLSLIFAMMMIGVTNFRGEIIGAC